MQTVDYRLNYVYIVLFPLSSTYCKHANLGRVISLFYAFRSVEFHQILVNLEDILLSFSTGVPTIPLAAF